jgi:hypothetical protein
MNFVSGALQLNFVQIADQLVFLGLCSSMKVIELLRIRSPGNCGRKNSWSTWGRQPFHYRGPNWLFISLSRAAEKKIVDSKRNCT